MLIIENKYELCEIVVKPTSEGSIDELKFAFMLVGMCDISTARLEYGVGG